jgi:WD40 repeat protein
MRLISCVFALACCAVASASSLFDSANQRRGREQTLDTLIDLFRNGHPDEQVEAASRLLARGRSALEKVRALENLPSAKMAERARQLADDIEARVWGAPNVSTSHFFPSAKFVTYVDRKQSRSYVLVRAIPEGPDLVCLRGTPLRVGRIGVSRDEKYLAVPGGRRDGVVLVKEDYWIGIWDWQRGRLIKKLQGHSDGVYTALFSPDGKTVVSAGLDGTIRFWSVESGLEMDKIDAHQGWVCHIEISPSGMEIMSCGEDKSLRLWDVKTKTKVAEISLGVRAAQLAYSQDGNWAACVAGSNWVLQNMQWVNPDGCLLVLDLKGRKVHRKLDYQHAFPQSVAINPSGTRVLTGDNLFRLTLWDIAAGAELAHVKAERQSIYGVCFMNNLAEAWAMDGGANFMRWELPKP